MERNKWQTAMRCLEVALHPNTSDDEVLAGINGFHRTVQGAPLRDFLLQSSAGDAPAAGPPAPAADRLSAENSDLRRLIGIHEAKHVLLSNRLAQAEARVNGLRDDLVAAERRAEMAEQVIVECRAVMIALRDENRELAFNLDRARRPTVTESAAEPSIAFRRFLDTAREHSDGVEVEPVSRSRAGSAGPSPTATLLRARRTPWMA